MQTSDPLSSGYRRSALTLHGLHEQDRQWLLGQLPAPERDGVVTMLAELDRMQLRVDAADVDAVLGVAAEPVAGGVEGDALRALDQAPASAVLRALKDEPDRLIAIVCSQRKWRWTAELLSLLGEARAAAIARLMHSERAPARVVCDAVVTAAAARVSADVQQSGFESALEAAAGNRRAGKGKRSWMRLFGWPL